MNSLIGTYECKMDAKGRIAIPVVLKNQLVKVINNGFVLKRSVYQSCLELYPMEQWEELMQKLKRKNRDKKIHNQFIRRFLADSRPIELDGAGRLLVPRDLAGKVTLKKQIILSTAIDIIEIWDKEKYEQAIEAVEEDFTDMMDEIMGNE